MTDARILIVESHAGTARRLNEAFSASTLPTPIHRPDGESAVLWVGAHECDLCILNSDLPGIDGLETLARMRHRRPGLPAIMISGSSSQELAIAAFRYGVIDFVLMNGDFGRVVAKIAQREIQKRAGQPALKESVTIDPRLLDLPPERLAPTYQNRLRVIGRQLDVYGYRSISVLEVQGGFLVRALPARSRVPEALEFPDRDFQSLIRSSIKEHMSGDAQREASVGDLVPTGYEDLLRAIGYRMDELSAESIIIAELIDLVVVAGRGQNEVRSAVAIEPFQMFLRGHDVEYLLNEAFLRRGSPANARSEPREPEPYGLKSIFKRLN